MRRNNNFAEYFMGNYIPPVDNASQVYTSDANVAISVDGLKARNRGFRARGVTELPYFSLMEFGGGPQKYAMRCPAQAAAPGAAVAVPPSATSGPINIQRCSGPPASPAQMLWQSTPVPGTDAVLLQLTMPTAGPDDDGVGNKGELCLTAVRHL